MNINTHFEDADRLISFFEHDREIYEETRCSGGILSFCLSVFNLDVMDIKEFEEAYNDLNSIIMVISRSLNGEKLLRFNNVVKGGVEHYGNWLRSVYRRKIEVDEELLFNKSLNLSIVAKGSSKKVLPDDYFALCTEYTGYKVSPILNCQLADECKMDNPVDLIFIDGDTGAVACAHNDLQWTDRNKIWTGSKMYFERIVGAKYRKVADKRLVAILSEVYKVAGEKMLFQTVSVERKSLRGKDSYVIDLNNPDEGCFMSIRSKVT